MLWMLTWNDCNIRNVLNWRNSSECNYEYEYRYNYPIAKSVTLRAYRSHIMNASLDDLTITQNSQHQWQRSCVKPEWNIRSVNIHGVSASCSDDALSKYTYLSNSNRICYPLIISTHSLLLMHFLKQYVSCEIFRGYLRLVAAPFLCDLLYLNSA